MTRSKEIWIPLPIDKYSDKYDISNNGNVRSYTGRTKTRKLIPCINSMGYYQVGLSHKGSVKYISIHRLVALAFLPRPNGKIKGKGRNIYEVNHINGDRLDNHVDNLQWVKHWENCYHRDHVLNNSGFNVKLKIEDVKLIKKMLKAGVPQNQISKLFNVKQSQISRIKTGKRWWYVDA